MISDQEHRMICEIFKEVDDAEVNRFHEVTGVCLGNHFSISKGFAWHGSFNDEDLGCFRALEGILNSLKVSLSFVDDSLFDLEND